MPPFNYKKRSRISDFLNMGLTVLIMLLMYKALAGTPVPEQEILPITVKEDVTIVQTETILAFLPEKVELKQVVKKEVVAKRKMKRPVKRKVDISDFKGQLESLKQSHLDNPSRPQSLLPPVDAPPVLEIGSSNNGRVYQQLTLDDQASSRIIVPKSNRGIRGSRENEFLDIDKSSSIGIKKSGKISSTGSINAPKEKVLNPAALLAPAVTPEIVIKPQVKKIAPIYPELISWLKKNHTGFSGVVRHFMGATPAHLTSSVKFRAGERIFEIYIACHEQQFEIRICLIEGDQTTLLIDKDFKKQSNFFRTGTIHRDTENRIFSFGTSQESPSDARTSEFYQVFLSWWETQKKESERDK